MCHDDDKYYPAKVVTSLRSLTGLGLVRLQGRPWLPTVYANRRTGSMSEESLLRLCPSDFTPKALIQRHDTEDLCLSSQTQQSVTRDNSFGVRFGIEYIGTLLAIRCMVVDRCRETSIVVCC